MQSFLDLIPQGKLSDEAYHALASRIITRRVAKGEILLRKGDKMRKHYFVKSGLLRSYTLDDNGKEHIFMFAPEGWIISDIGWQVPGKEADLYIDAVESSEVEVVEDGLISPTDQPSEEAIQRLTNRIYVLQKRIILLMSASLRERYLDFLATYPAIAQRVPQKMIASYLGVTPEALSKIRGDLTKQDRHQ
ncbi:Crp/Fnr family transcriptional regulator [Spirosoma rhododendri]|uniref:Crp/Fnr family transcriptional regulator n=1 Tax=Spirosoma rhododendri TaxID=2728024 RepID=A0A7L5DQL7_9BACT|nr:Crp/Fnr family transcriptional regulator [Spirosoma rhododendri]QJD80706.1 Crp/Fnr family transcriptional regulator [Spirosoma rhododendri]